MYTKGHLNALHFLFPFFLDPANFGGEGGGGVKDKCIGWGGKGAKISNPPGSSSGSSICMASDMDIDKSHPTS